MVLEATGNAMAVVRVLSPYVARVIMANPLQVKAIAEQAERAYQHFVAQWQPQPTIKRRATNTAAWSRGAPRQPG